MNVASTFPFVLPYGSVHPALKGPFLGCHTGAAVLGRVALGHEATLGAYAVLRADGHVIEVGDSFYIGARGTLHIAHARYGTFVGNRVTVGRNAIVHGCTVGDDCVIGGDAIVLDGATIAPGSIVAPGSVVFPRTSMPAGWWCAGFPAKPVRELSGLELQELHLQIRKRSSRSGPMIAKLEPGSSTQDSHDRYVAATASCDGLVQMAEGSSIWFGCVVKGGGSGVRILSGANVQDNATLISSGEGLCIGEHSTIGHNAFLSDCTVGDRVLIGMGSQLAAGTHVEHDVLVAAGAQTTRGQRLDSGWIWGGRPARPISRMTSSTRELIQEAATVYREYAREFARSQSGVHRFR